METKIKTLLEGLLCFKSEEIQYFLANLKFMPEYAQEKLLNELEKAKSMQESLMKNSVQKDTNFYQNLDSFLNNSTKKIIDDYETQEHKNADKLLDEI